MVDQKVDTYKRVDQFQPAYTFVDHQDTIILAQDAFRSVQLSGTQNKVAFDPPSVSECEQHCAAVVQYSTAVHVSCSCSTVQLNALYYYS